MPNPEQEQVTMNNPYELGRDEMQLLLDAIDFYISNHTDPHERLKAREMKEMIKDSYTVWVDVYE